MSIHGLINCLQTAFVTLLDFQNLLIYTDATMDMNYEIERRYLIRYPDLRWLDSAAEKTEIEQTYLIKEDGWNSNRLRKRGIDGQYTFTHTRKKRISELTRIEDEHEICAEEYSKLLQKADPQRNVIHKFRYCLDFQGKLLEIDIFDFWQDRAIMEIELENEGEQFQLPPEISIIKEISSDKRYSNASMAKEVPFEQI